MSKAADKRIVDVFAALGDKTRLALVRELSQGEPMSATALAEDARVTRQAISKHLGVLEEAGLVRRHRTGREVLYELEPGRVDDARDYLDGISAGWDRAIERLRKLVER